MKRRTVVRTAAASLVAGATGCGRGDEAKRSSGGDNAALSFWAWVPNIDRAVDLWNSNNPNVRVQLNTVPGGSQGTYNKMYAAAKAGNAPDIAQVEYWVLRNFAQLGNLEDIREYIKPAAKASYPDWVWGQVSDGETVHAVPQDIAPMVMFYRKDVFAAAGMATPPATWAEFADAAARIHQLNPRQFITNFTPNHTDWFAGLVWQAGGSWFSRQGDQWSVDMTSGASAKVAGYWQKLVDDGLVKVEGNWSDQWNADLRDGTLATWLVGAWGGPSLATAAPDTTGRWGVAPLPQWKDGHPVTGNWGGSTNVVMKGSRNPRLAAEFIQWLNTDLASLNILGADSGLYAASNNWRQSPSFSAPFPFFGGEKLYEVAAGQTLPDSWVWGPTMTDTLAAIQNSLSGLGAGSGTIVNALAQAQLKTIETMKSQGFPVA